MTHGALFIFVALALVLSPNGSHAYERATHEDMSEAAAFSSVLAKSETLSAFGLKGGLDDPKLTFPNSEGAEKAIKFLIRDGANFEDNLFLGAPFRVRHHFYDPHHHRGLQWGLVSGEKSPDWALEDKQDYAGVSLRQDYSLKDARDYLYKTLTSAQEDERKKNFGLTLNVIAKSYA